MTSTLWKAIWVVWSLCCVCMLVATVMSFYVLSLSDAERRSAMELTATRTAMESIKKLRSLVPEDSTNASAFDDKIQRVRAGLAPCEIAESSIAEIGSVVRTPIPKTAFAREDLSVRFRELPLEKIFAFIRNEEQHERKLVCSRIQLRTAVNPSTESEQKWDVDLLLTQIVPAPKKEK